MKAGETKGNLPVGKMILLGLLAGAFIALGAVSSSTAAFSISNAGLARLVSGIVFPVGLILIVNCGAELFTGNNLIGMAVLGKMTTVGKMVKNLVIVWLSNFVGSVFLAAVTYLSGNFNMGGNALGAYTIKVAVGKASLGFVPALCSAVLCNILVCMAVLLATAARSTSGKIMGAFIPIFAFVTAGFEHSVANMYYIPAGLFAKLNPDYVAKAQELYGYTAEQLANLNIGTMFTNILTVTLGNLIGGVVLVGFAYFAIYGKKADK